MPWESKRANRILLAIEPVVDKGNPATMTTARIDHAEYLEPELAARALRERPGFCFLDSSLPGQGAVSLLASDPEEVLSGSASDWAALEREIGRRMRTGFDLGVPESAAIGWVDFDGSFRFGIYPRVHCWLHNRQEWINPPEVGEIPPDPESPTIDFQPLTAKEDFVAMVSRAQEYIAAGDIYQVCLAHRFQARWEGDAWSFYETLRSASPAPHSAFIDLGGRQVASASPECFLKMSGRRIITRPIKGTRPRRSDPLQDSQSAYELMTSKKEIAELVMITDLERNDLGKVCEFGSVIVSDLLKHEQYEQVHHLVSTVEGNLREGVSHAGALRACFPGGSISGAPKKRALEIIAELEQHPRGLYTGAIGYFGFNGESQFSIAIRTAVFEGGVASFHSGAGIVADSVPESEWAETLHKARGILAAADAG
jgi:aminodeoxychorismate synthase component I